MECRAIKNLKPGGRVIAEPHTLAYGTCETCRSGHPYCAVQAVARLWHRWLCRRVYLLLSDKGTDSVAVLTEPIAVAMNVIDRTKVELGVARTIHVMKENTEDIINKVTNGRGADVTMERSSLCCE